MTRSCFISLTRKLNSNLTFLYKYDQIIKDYLQNNIIEEANKNKLMTSVHYLLHHAVIKTNRETTKTCKVFDASANIYKNEPSLNGILYSGPYLLPLIEDIFL